MAQQPLSSLKIAGACGYWGESASATPQLLRVDDLDVIIYDYLAEITMSIMARAKAKNPELGYATDFIDAVLKPNLKTVAERGVKLIANAGGVNPAACAAAARKLIEEQGLTLKVAIIEGDDLIAEKDAIASAAPAEMFTDAPFPPAEKIASANAYLGAFPIARALELGADIVITGRCADSALVLGACINAFGWTPDAHDKLAGGSLAGHIIECGPQATGGNFTDWRAAGDIAQIGYPVAEITPDGAFTVTKPEGTSGLVSVGTVSEQMVYEIGDPQAYLLPDVVCDFSEVVIEERSENVVAVSGAKGAPAPDSYKTSLTYEDGYRAGMILPFYGFDAAPKARALADAALARARAAFRRFNAGDFDEVSIEIIGADSQYGAHSQDGPAPREVALKIAAKHASPMGVGLLLKELAGIGLATPPGLTSFAGGRPKPSPVLRLFSYLTPKDQIRITINIDGHSEAFEEATGAAFNEGAIIRPDAPPAPDLSGPLVEAPLIQLAFARSGDKGDKANIGVIARRPDLLPYIWASLDEAAVASRLGHFIAGDDEVAKTQKVRRYLMPGAHAINFLVDDVLGGGGVASLRADPQGKGYGQILLAHPVRLPQSLLSEIS